MDGSYFDEVTVSRIKAIKMPPASKMVGRPKGSDKTNVIGTRKSSKKKLSCPKFSDLRDSEKEKFILSLCIGDDVTESILREGGKVEVVHINPTEIRTAVFAPDICLQTIQYMFTEEAWDRFSSYYESKSKFKFFCNSCSKFDEKGDDLISCECCLNSFHFRCVKLKQVVKKR